MLCTETYLGSREHQMKLTCSYNFHWFECVACVVGMLAFWWVARRSISATKSAKERKAALSRPWCKISVVGNFILVAEWCLQELIITILVLLAVTFQPLHKGSSLFFFYLTNKKQSKYFFIKKNKEVNLSYILNAPLIITGKYSRTGHERKVPSGDQISY